MSDRKCTHRKGNGTQCGAYAMIGAEFCYLHNPAIPDEEKRQTQTRGGEGRALMMIAEPLPFMKLETPSDAIILIADTINRVRAGELDVRIANCIGVLSGHLIKAFETAQLKDKVEMIDRIVLEKRLTKY
jgi:hypothetical protein